MLTKLIGIVGSIGFILLILLVIITAYREPEESLEYGKLVFNIGQDTYETLKENYSELINEALTNNDEEIQTNGGNQNGN